MSFFDWPTTKVARMVSYGALVWIVLWVLVQLAQ